MAKENEKPARKPRVGDIVLVQSKGTPFYTLGNPRSLFRPAIVTEITDEGNLHVQVFNRVRNHPWEAKEDQSGEGNGTWKWRD